MKKGFTMVELIAIVVIMALMLLIILPSINNTIKQSEGKKKETDLNNIYMAAENFLMDNYDEHKIDNVGDITYIYITDLINNNYMSINTLNPNNDASFTDKDAVKITRNDDGTFHYELYYFKTLIETLLEQYSLENTTGLVKDATNENLYYYTGTNKEVANNFLWYGGHQWRVLEFDTEANTLTLITQQPLTTIYPSSSVWTTKKEYESSYINTWLNEYFWNSLDSSIQSNILDTTFNVGIYTDVDEITTTQRVGLLDEEQYKRAGEVNSFLDIKDYFWLGNRYDSSIAYYVDFNGNFYNGNSTSLANGVRVVIKIFDLIITEGNGTLTSNYQVGNKSTNTNNMQVGEYINVPYSVSDNVCGDDNICTFRVVSKDEDSIKIVLNGLLPDTSAYGDSSIISTGHAVYTKLNKFIDAINDTYKYTENKIFYIGDYPYVSSKAENYENIKDEILKTNIGLPTVGEILSGNDIDMGIEKTFVDVNTIENPTASSYYWTMNRYSGSAVRHVGKDGNLNINNQSNVYGVRPVIFLKNNLTFTGGDGTPQNPYTLD